MVCNILFALVQSGVAPALIEHQERMDKRIKEEQAKAKLLADADDKAKRAAELQARIQAKTGKV